MSESREAWSPSSWHDLPYGQQPKVFCQAKTCAQTALISRRKALIPVALCRRTRRCGTALPNDPKKKEAPDGASSATHSGKYCSVHAVRRAGGRCRTPLSCDWWHGIPVTEYFSQWQPRDYPCRKLFHRWPKPAASAARPLSSDRWPVITGPH